jgi:hypothetical protein
VANALKVVMVERYRTGRPLGKNCTFGETEEHAITTETITGASLFEVRRKAAEWKAAHPKFRVTREDGPVGFGEQPYLLDRGEWVITIEYEDA